MTVIPLGRALPHGSSHLPSDSVGPVLFCLLGVAPRRDWPFHPDLTGYVSVPLILASRRTGVTRYAALWSPDFPLCDLRGTATAWLASRGHFTPRRSSPGNAPCHRRRTRAPFPDAIPERPAPASAPSTWGSRSAGGLRTDARAAGRPRRPVIRARA